MSSPDSPSSPPAAAAGAVPPRSTFPSVFLTHGGGPSYFMDVPPSHPFFAISKQSVNAQWLRDFARTYNLQGASAPKAIVVVSAHWESRGGVIRVSNQKQHTKLQYDYGGFPRETYELQYNPPGHPELASQIVSLLQAGGIKAELDAKWNFDHGVFVPLKMMWPEAAIPVVEVSIDHGWDPLFHLNVGKALRALKQQGVLLIGSGSSTHNFNPDGRANKQFMDALTTLVESPSLTAQEREQKAVLEWAKLPSARKAHPAEDHFVPFFVIVGAAEGKKGKLVGKVVPEGEWVMGSYLFE